MAELRQINSLRGLAALSVMSCHVFGGYLANAAPVFLQRFTLGVDLFFFISGFILTLFYGAAFGRGASVRNVGAFLWARFARLYPLYLFATAMWLPHFGTSDQYSGKTLVYNLLMLQTPWSVSGSWYAFAWSISVEWQVYLVFPFLARGLAALGSAAKSLLAMALIGILYHLVATPDEGTWITSPIIRLLPEFCIGMLVADCYRSGFLVALWQRDATMLALLTLFSFGMEFASSVFWAIVAMPLLMLASLHNTGAFSKPLRSVAGNWLGKISYGIYMTQGIMLAIGVILTPLMSGSRLSQYILLVSCCALNIGLGAVSQRVIEEPARKFLRGLIAPRAGAVPRQIGQESSAHGPSPDATVTG